MGVEPGLHLDRVSACLTSDSGGHSEYSLLWLASANDF